MSDGKGKGPTSGSNGTTTTPPPRPLPIVRVGDIPDPGPTKWLVDKLWTAGAFGIVGAEPKSWKSWLTLQIAIAVASGEPLFKRYSVEKGRVIVFSAEGGKNLVRSRAMMICCALDLDIKSLDLEVIDLPSLRLDVADHVKVLHDVVESRRPSLVVLDPLREMHAGDENDAAAVATLLLPLRLLQRKFECAIMLVHHMAKQGADSNGRRLGQRLRGSSALHGAVDSALYLEPKGEGESKRVKVSAEHRAAAEPEPITLRLRSVMRELVDEAVWIEPVDAVEDDEAQAARESHQAYEDARRRVLAAVRESTWPGRDPLRSKNAVAMASAMNKQKALAILKILIEEGEITQGEDGVFRLAKPDA
jgi:RecA-family ATPase